MLTPEEIKGILLPDEYIKAHGVFYESLADEYYYDEKGFYHCERMFDKPMDEGGTPFTGLAFAFFDDTGQISYYMEMKDGYHFGDYVGYYFGSGALSFYHRFDEKEHYCYQWHENGVLKKKTVWNRKDSRKYRVWEYDKTGRLIRETPE